MSSFRFNARKSNEARAILPILWKNQSDNNWFEWLKQAQIYFIIKYKDAARFIRQPDFQQPTEPIPLKPRRPQLSVGADGEFTEEDEEENTDRLERHACEIKIWETQMAYIAKAEREQQ